MSYLNQIYLIYLNVTLSISVLYIFYVRLSHILKHYVMLCYVTINVCRLIIISPIVHVMSTSRMRYKSTCSMLIRAKNCHEKKENMKETDYDEDDRPTRKLIPKTR